MISATTGLIALRAVSVDTRSAAPARSIACGAALGSARNETPTLQPPESDSSAPPCQSLTDASLPLKPPTLNGLPLSRSSAASARPSLRPFGALQVDWPLITIRYVPVREASLSHHTSSRRFGSFGNSTEAISLLPSDASTSVYTTFSAL